MSDILNTIYYIANKGLYTVEYKMLFNRRYDHEQVIINIKRNLVNKGFTVKLSDKIIDNIDDLLCPGIIIINISW